MPDAVLVIRRHFCFSKAAWYSSCIDVPHQSVLIFLSVANFSVQPWLLDWFRGPCVTGRRPSRHEREFECTGIRFQSYFFYSQPLIWQTLFSDWLPPTLASFSGFLLGLSTLRSALGGTSARSLLHWWHSPSRLSPTWLFHPPTAVRCGSGLGG